MRDKKIYVTTIGELVADFSLTGVTGSKYPIYTQNPGGGPANVAVCIARLGGISAFLGKVSNDAIGCSLKSALQSEGVICSGVVMDAAYQTMLAFIQTDSNGERSFTFYSDRPADLQLCASDLKQDLIAQSRFIAYGGRNVSTQTMRATIDAAEDTAHKNTTAIAFDPNIRLNAWPDSDTAKKILLHYIQKCNCLKISDDELYFLTGEPDTDKAAKMLFHPDMFLLSVTKGERGADIYTDDFKISHPGYSVRSIDTTGAGDTYFGSLLYCLSQSGETIPCQSEAEAILDFCCACGAMATTAQGAIAAMPTLSSVQAFLAQNRR